jgi:hypothetical protein
MLGRKPEAFEMIVADVDNQSAKGIFGDFGSFLHSIVDPFTIIFFGLALVFKCFHQVYT